MDAQRLSACSEMLIKRGFVRDVEAMRKLFAAASVAFFLTAALLFAYAMEAEHIPNQGAGGPSINANP